MTLLISCLSSALLALPVIVFGVTCLWLGISLFTKPTQP